MSLNIKYLILTKALLWLYMLSFGQSANDTILLKEVDIVEKRKLSGIGINFTEISKIHLKRCEQVNLSSLLDNYSPVFIKSYYPGGISTSSIRGLGASHVQVVWNGMNLNSPMLGQADFSGIPVSIIDEVRIYHGSGNIAENSGALGGSIHLNSQADWQNKLSLKVNLGYGSFNTQREALTVACGSNKFQSKTIIYYNHSNNDFTYIDYTEPSYPERKNIDGDFTQKGFQQDFYYRLKKRNLFSLKTWGQTYDRNMAPVIGTDYSQLPEENEQQYENSLSVIADWAHFRSKHIFNVKSGILYSDLNYINKLLSLDSKNRALTNTQKINYKYKHNKYLIINVLASHDYIKAYSVNYEDDKSRQQSSFTGNTELFFDRISLTAGNRTEIVDNIIHPFAPSLGFDFNPVFLQNIHLSGSYSENMHYPTLNNLYWTPGGNTDLLPETSKAVEIHLTHEYRVDKQKFAHSLSSFSSNIDNMIMWLPNINNIWSAINIRKVHARGIEFVQNIESIKLLFFSININSIYCYTLSTNKNKVNDQDLSYKKQLIYVPKHQVKLNTDIKYKKMVFHLAFIYNSKRFISTDNLYYIPEYYLTNISVSQEFKRNKSAMDIHFSINNLFNQNYIAVAGYPMPGRNFMISLKYKFTK